MTIYPDLLLSSHVMYVDALDRLQTALNLAAAGDVLVIPPGDYVGPFTVDKALTLIADGQVRILSATSGWATPTMSVTAAARIVGLTFVPRGTYGGTLLNITAPDVQVDRCTFDGSAATTDYYYSIYAGGAHRTRITSCTFDGGTHGWFLLEVDDSTDMRIEGNTLTGGRVGAGANAIHLDGNSQRAIITRNRLMSVAYHGILVWCGQIAISDNLIYQPTRTGIFVTGEAPGGPGNTCNVTITGNVIDTPGDSGIQCEDDVHQTAIVGNVVQNAGQHGIYAVRACTDIAIAGNTVLNATKAAIGSILFGAEPNARLAVSGNVCRTYGWGGCYDECVSMTKSGNVEST